MSTISITTIDELRDAYTTTILILRAERNMRAKVFAKQPDVLEKKLAEIDLVIDNVTAMKDALKPHLQAQQPQQMELLVFPPITRYQ